MFKNNPTMVVGYDVSHKKGTKSSMAFSATMNRHYTKYWSRTVQAEDEGQEPVHKIRETLTAALAAFKLESNCYPKQIFFMRDGVGDSQKRVIMENELAQVRAALEQSDETRNIKIVFLMVNKRIKTKLVQKMGS